MKRFFKTLALLALICILGLCVFTGCDKEEKGMSDEGSEGLSYDYVYGENTYCIVNGIGTCTDTDIVIPAMHDNIPVRVIDNTAFVGCSNLKSVTIPSSVTMIGNYAFAQCSSLTSITIPSSVRSIGLGAFRECDNLIQVDNGILYVDKWAIGYDKPDTTISLRENTVGIADYAFSGWGKLKSITIPSSMTYIGDYAFRNCGSLTSITIPDSVEQLGMCAFEYCENLYEVTLGTSLQYIGIQAFENCKKLTSVTFKNVDGWEAKDGRGYATISSSSLADKSKAAYYLKSNFVNLSWVRSDN